MSADGRYRDNDAATVICRDCSTRVSAVLVRVEDVAEHDEMHFQHEQESEPPADKLGPLMTQVEARAEARRMCSEGVPAVAGPVPINAWGGQEKGWTVYIAAGG